MLPDDPDELLVPLPLVRPEELPYELLPLERPEDDFNPLEPTLPLDRPEELLMPLSPMPRPPRSGELEPSPLTPRPLELVMPELPELRPEELLIPELPELRPVGTPIPELPLDGVLRPDPPVRRVGSLRFSLRPVFLPNEASGSVFD